MRLLTTGTSSGLGKYIYENLGGIGLTRTTSSEEIEKVRNDGIDTIIHCASNSGRGIDSEHIYHYIEDNVFLTKKLVSFPHKKFIFLSSVDIYPKGTMYHSEDEIIDIDSVKGIYGISKIISESIVKTHCKNYVILRCSSLIGKYSRKNSLIRIIENRSCTLTISSNSIYNCVLYTDLLDFITFSIDHDIKGIYNTVSSENVVVSEIVEILKKKAKFGTYFYNVGNIDNSKISTIFPSFKKTSREIVTQLISGLING